MRRLRDRARNLGSRAIDELSSREGRSDAFGAAVRGVQRGRRQIDEQAARVLGVLGLATQEDLAKVNRRIGRLRKRLLALLDELE